MSLNVGNGTNGVTNGLGAQDLLQQSLVAASMSGSNNPTLSSSMSQLLQNFAGSGLGSLGNIIPAEFDFLNECANTISLDKK